MTPKDFLTRPHRVPMEIPVTLTTIDTFLESEIMNLSKGGIFVRADISLPLGTEVDLQFRLPHSERVIRAVGTVVWTRRRGTQAGKAFPEHPPGMGVQFRDIQMTEIEALLDEIERLMKLA